MYVQALISRSYFGKHEGQVLGTGDPAGAKESVRLVDVVTGYQRTQADTVLFSDQPYAMFLSVVMGNKVQVLLVAASPAASGGVKRENRHVREQALFPNARPRRGVRVLGRY